ncbi:LAMI_0A04610g1_1 [Lachancea mirantina]|uniref:Tubulin-specific chaperone A n=1 Tax=Lachancea mirantina TaxID=1230905 RepID=A0A1G4IPL0_9SACH|nr:LAMI_0A04610g1_1 [Lachancea mirantina]
MAPTQFEIKFRALQRLVKEESYYQQDLQEQEAHVKSLENLPNVDPFDLKKQKEVMEDTQRLLPTLHVKIKEFKDDLEAFLESYKGSEDVSSAHAIIRSADEVLKIKA